MDPKKLKEDQAAAVAELGKWKSSSSSKKSGASSKKSKKPKPTKKPVVPPKYPLPPPSILPLDIEGGEIVAVLPFTHGYQGPTPLTQAYIDNKPGDGFKLENSLEGVLAEESGESGKLTIDLGLTVPSKSPMGLNSLESNNIVAQQPAQESKEEENPPRPSGKIKCPKCGEFSIVTLRNAYFPVPGGPPKCIGIPTCMNIKCMFISPNIFPLPVPEALLKPQPAAESLLSGLSPLDPRFLEIFKEQLEYGQKLKKSLPLKPPLIDTKPLDSLRRMPPDIFEKALREAFGGVIPELPK